MTVRREVTWLLRFARTFKCSLLLLTLLGPFDDRSYHSKVTSVLHKVEMAVSVLEWDAHSYWHWQLLSFSGGGANSPGGRTTTYDFAKISKKKLHEIENIFGKLCTGDPPDPPLIFMQFSAKIVPNNRFWAQIQGLASPLPVWEILDLPLIAVVILYCLHKQIKKHKRVSLSYK